MFVVALIAMLFAAAQGLTCPCNDNPPSSDFSCEDQVSFGQCGADFMSGYCECACQVCAYEDDSMMMMMTTAPETEMSVMTMDEAPEVEKPKSEKALARAAEKAAAKAARQAEKAAEKAAAKAARKAERQAAKAAEKAAEEAAESG